jgi:hypothetical protein
MKATLCSALLTIVLASCAPLASPTPPVTQDAVQLLTPTSPQGTTFFDGCTHMVSYPAQLTTTDGILFESPQEMAASVFITARRRSDAERTLSLEELVTQAGAQWGSTAESSTPSFEKTTVVDYLGDTLDGLQANFVSDNGQHIRVMVVVRPQTLLGDMLSDDVVYEVVAQAPETTWPEWAPLFDVVFQTFHPKSCGGV